MNALVKPALQLEKNKPFPTIKLTNTTEKWELDFSRSTFHSYIEE
jgi:hypothetical protein